MTSAGRSWARAGLTAAGIVALDQASKAIVRATIPPGGREAVIPGLHLVHTTQAWRSARSPAAARS
jgi:hypothetical protein